VADAGVLAAPGLEEDGLLRVAVMVLDFDTIEVTLPYDGGIAPPDGAGLAGGAGGAGGAADAGGAGAEVATTGLEE